MYLLLGKYVNDCDCDDCKGQGHYYDMYLNDPKNNVVWESSDCIDDWDGLAYHCQSGDPSWFTIEPESFKKDRVVSKDCVEVLVLPLALLNLQPSVNKGD